jgi:hypothetical protein
MRDRIRQVLALLLKLAVTAGLLAWVFQKIDLAQLWQALVAARWAYLWPIWGLAIVSYAILSFKLALILRRQGCDASTGSLFAISAVTTLYGMVLPGMLDLSAKWYLLKQQTGKGTHALSSMVYNQFTTTLVVLVVGLAAVTAVTPPHRVGTRVLCLGLIAVLMAVGLLLLHRTMGPRLTRWAGLLLGPMPGLIRRPGLKVLDQMAVFQTAGWPFHFNALALSLVANTVVGTIIYKLAALAAGIHLPLALHFWQCTAIFVLGKLPISVAEFGVREATLVESMAPYGVEPSAALVMSMVIFTNRLLLASIGAAFQLRWVLSPRFSRGFGRPRRK